VRSLFLLLPRVHVVCFWMICTRDIYRPGMWWWWWWWWWSCGGFGSSSSPPLVFLLLQGVPSKRDVGKLQRKGYKDVWVMSIDVVAIWIHDWLVLEIFLHLGLWRWQSCWYIASFWTVWNCHYHVALVVSLSSIGSRCSLWQLWQVMMHQLWVKKCFFSVKGGEH